MKMLQIKCHCHGMLLFDTKKYQTNIETACLMSDTLPRLAHVMKHFSVRCNWLNAARPTCSLFLSLPGTWLKSCMTWKFCFQSHRDWGPSFSSKHRDLWGVPGMIDYSRQTLTPVRVCLSMTKFKLMIPLMLLWFKPVIFPPIDEKRPFQRPFVINHGSHCWDARRGHQYGNGCKLAWNGRLLAFLMCELSS